MHTKKDRENETVEVVDVPKSEVAEREEAILAFWQEHDIFNKTLQTPAGGEPKGEYIFYDGPPFATGLPHYGHLLAGTMKDAIPRFRTMQGYHVRRQWGWDCHGLPVENLIEKKLGLATKRDIEAHGIKHFNEACRDSVMEYASDWKTIIKRMGRFVDMESDYKTMDSTYTESVWWVFKALHEKGLVYEGFKSMHLCPRCGTTLSNFEVNQGYQDIKDISVFVELPLVEEENTALLVWTTTPWTLPGNMAAAVNEEHEYAVVEVTVEAGTKRLIVAKDRVAAVFKDQEHVVVETRQGSDLLGKKYEPPFDYIKQMNVEGAEHAWQVLHADFVEIGEEGTGLVHIAPAYGEDDMNLGKEHDLPMVHHVDEGGHFAEFVTDFAGQLVKPKDDKESDINHMDADIEIIRALAAAGKLYAKEKITHSYPHCWRCHTPLLNYATTSWFVEVTKMRDELVQANQAVAWVPEHVGSSRFGKWLEGARDWAVSRQRYWGAPIPIWRNPETKEIKVFGNLAELQEHVPKSGNQYRTLRHGESTKNVAQVVIGDPEAPYPLTEKGIVDVKAAAKDLVGKVDLIVSSPVLRTRQTAELVAAEIGMEASEIVFDERIRETDFGVCEGQSYSEYKAAFPAGKGKFTAKPEGGESWNDQRQRVGAFLAELEEKHTNKSILIISHGDPLLLLQAAAAGWKEEEILGQHTAAYPQKGVVQELLHTPFPHNDTYELDFHRPYIDDVVLEESEVRLERVPDVFDCWFESGSMPYAQHHYLGEEPDVFQQTNYPAEFIAEGLDQTRGWFYSLLVLGTALFGKSPYENVIVNGLVLAEDGKKMSKSLQNYPDPMELANRTGVDAMRFYLLSSPIVKAEDLNFSEKEVLELQRKNIGRLHNVLTMYEMFADGTGARDDSDHVLDEWIVARTNQLVAEVTAGYEGYELDKATRPITDYIDDLSVWYLRRSRDRLKGSDAADKERALATLRYTLRTLALTMAPAMPFYAEYLWQAVRDEHDTESVHLGAWPIGGEVETERLEQMSEVRAVVTAALEARTQASLKVRQPIASVSGPDLSEAMQQIVLDELNAKAYVCNTEVGIDTVLTPELIAEGAVRELMRAVQGARKKEGLEPQDEIILTIDTTEAGQAAITAHKELLTTTVGATAVEYGAIEGEPLVAGEYRFTFMIAKT